MSGIKKSTACMLLSLGAISFTSHAAVFTNAGVAAGNFGNFYGSYSSSETTLALDQGFKQSSNTAYQGTFYGSDGSGDPFQVDFSGSASAQVTDGSLHVYSQASLLNPQALGSNVPFLVPSGPYGASTNQAGLPEAYSVSARARYATTVTLAPAQSVASIRFVLALDGKTVGSDFQAGNPYVSNGNVDVSAYLQQDAGGKDYASIENYISRDNQFGADAFYACQQDGRIGSWLRWTKQHANECEQDG